LIFKNNKKLFSVNNKKRFLKINNYCCTPDGKFSFLKIYFARHGKFNCGSDGKLIGSFHGKFDGKL
jgi:hypothetical protein